MNGLTIRNLSAGDAAARRCAAQLLVDGFRDLAPAAWPTLNDALEEVSEALQSQRICRAAFLEGQLVGWIGAMPQYGQHGWELHPLVVSEAHRRRGIGRALVADLENQVRQHGGGMIYLGTDDECDATSLAGVDLYPDLCSHLQRITCRKAHPLGFYQRVGFQVVGVLPDANAPGKPDILMAKRL